MKEIQLNEIAIFQGLSKRTLADLQAVSRQITYREGNLVCQEQGPSIGLYAILDGFVQFGKLSGRENRQRLLKILGPGDIFAEEALFSPDNRVCPGFARAMTDTSVMFIEQGVFLLIMGKHPALSKRICNWLAQELRIYECKLVELAYEPVEQNLLRQLFVLSKRFGTRQSEGIRLEPKLSRQDWADLLGVHIDTIIHEFGKLRDEGLIAVKDHQIIILNEDQLVARIQPNTTCLSEILF